MPYIDRLAMSLKSRWSGVLKSNSGLRSLSENSFAKSVSDVGLEHSINNPARWLSTVSKLGFPRQSIADANYVRTDKLVANGFPVLFVERHAGKCIHIFQSPVQLFQSYGVNAKNPIFARSFASKTSKKQGETASETKKEISTIDDPFDAPTYNIPEKPVTFTEGASYTLIILAGLGVAAAAGYGVFKELIFEPKEYKVFNKALKRIQDDSQVRVRIGSPITGYGQESRNRAARQRIPHKIHHDEDGVEHVEINFHIRGPHGNGKVYTSMFKNKGDKQWQFTFLIVEILSPSKTQLILESYLPA